ncbi:MAG: hypothetical protein RLZZ292_4044, partial [Bacteroidota bacterium]
MTIKEEQQFLDFEQNIGQMGNTALLFKATDAQATYFFTKNDIRSVVRSSKDQMQTAYALQFVGANENVRISGSGKQRPEAGAKNYITEAGAFGNVPMHNQLHYNNLWDGVNAFFYESKEGKGTMKYDFIVQPNADPSVVKLKMGGVKDLKINDKGELEFTTPFGTLQKGKPFTYQTIGGKQVEVASEYILNDNGDISFKLGKYDPSVSLVIDPIALKWSSFLGSSGAEGYGMYVHPTTGRIYITGATPSANFPNTLGRVFGGVKDAFVTCIEKDGSSILWSTYLGGDGEDIGRTLFVDAANDVFVTGSTKSTNFPTNGSTTAYDATYNGGTDFFVTRLNSTGATLKYSTYLGGSSEEYLLGTKMVCTNGKVYVGGSSASSNFPTTVGAYQANKLGGADVPVWFCLNTNVGGTAGLEYATFFSGTNANIGETFVNVVEDKDGNLWFVGNAQRTGGLPISSNAVQKASDFNPLDNALTSCFVAKFSKSGQYLYSSFVQPFWQALEGTGSGFRPSIDVDLAGNVYVTESLSIANATAATVKKSPNIVTLNELSPLTTMENVPLGEMTIGYLAKIPYNLTPQFDFVSVFPTEGTTEFGSPQIDVDKKGNIHILNYHTTIINNIFPITAGAMNPN